MPGRRQAVILSDGISYDGAGNILGCCASKVIALPGIKAAVAARGTIQFLADALGMMACHESFDNALDSARDALLGARRISDDYATGCEVIIVGWSARQSGMVSAMLSSAADFEPQSGDILLAPLPDLDALERAGLLKRGGIDLGADPVDGLLRVMKIQNEALTEPVEGTGGPLGHYVGGRVTLTVLEEHRITQRIVHNFGCEGPNAG